MGFEESRPAWLELAGATLWAINKLSAHLVWAPGLSDGQARGCSAVHPTREHHMGTSGRAPVVMSAERSGLEMSSRLRATAAAIWERCVSP